MSNKVSYEEQREMGLIRRNSNFVEPLRGEVLPPARREPQEPINFLPQAMPTALYASKAVQDDNAITQAQASLLISKAYVAAALIVTIALMYIIYRARGGDSYNYFFGGILIWGLSIFAILYLNRGQGLHHSATGLGHHEIDSRERIALHAIDKHTELIKARWKIEQGGDNDA